MSALSGKVAIITGAGSGLGEATTLALAGAGAAVAALDLRAADAERVAARAREIGAESLAAPVDVAEEDQIQAAIAKVMATWGRLDIVVNNAGMDFVQPIVELTSEQWDRVQAVNLRAAFLFAKAALPIMQSQRAGHFVNVASTAAKRAWANAAAYHASKWGLIGFTRGLGVEGRPFGIKATCIVPGGMRTHFFDKLDPPPDLTNLQDPQNVANVILFALSQPAECAIQEVIVTPLTETSWP